MWAVDRGPPGSRYFASRDSGMTTLVVIPIEGDSPRARTQSCKRGAVSRLLGSCVSEVCRDAGARDTVGSQLSRPALWLGPRPSHSTRAVARVRALADLAPRGQRHHHSAAAPRGAPRASFGEGGTAAALGPSAQSAAATGTDRTPSLRTTIATVCPRLRTSRIAPSCVQISPMTMRSCPRFAQGSPGAEPDGASSNQERPPPSR